jgi:hypothetical protein
MADNVPGDSLAESIRRILNEALEGSDFNLRYMYEGLQEPDLASFAELTGRLIKRCRRVSSPLQNESTS